MDQVVLEALREDNKRKVNARTGVLGFLFSPSLDAPGQVLVCDPILSHLCVRIAEVTSARANDAANSASAPSKTAA